MACCLRAIALDFDGTIPDLGYGCAAELVARDGRWIRAARDGDTP